ncbi:MAG: hypothetical protein JW938_02680 [Candidatus Omnitrophica bacterium]|nr:hypothetical protein [Candidatus Omnitrophota bacterium]
MKKTSIAGIFFLMLCFILTFMGSVCVFVWGENDAVSTSVHDSVTDGSRDPKTEAMIKKIRSLGLSLHPAQHYEQWELPKKNVTQ